MQQLTLAGAAGPCYTLGYTLWCVIHWGSWILLEIQMRVSPGDATRATRLIHYTVYIVHAIHLVNVCPPSLDLYGFHFNRSTYIVTSPPQPFVKWIFWWSTSTSELVPFLPPPKDDFQLAAGIYKLCLLLIFFYLCVLIYLHLRRKKQSLHPEVSFVPWDTIIAMSLLWTPLLSNSFNKIVLQGQFYRRISINM